MLSPLGERGSMGVEAFRLFPIRKLERRARSGPRWQPEQPGRVVSFLLRHYFHYMRGLVFFKHGVEREMC